MTTRARLLGAFFLLAALAMVVGLVVGLVVQRELLLTQLGADVDFQLRQEVEELTTLAGGRDPSTGEPFADDVAAIFDTFISRNVPADGEGLFTLVAGEPYASTPAPLQLLADEALVARWAALTDPDEQEVETEAGRVRYLAVPVRYQDEVVGTFVVATFLQGRLDAVERVIYTGIVTYGIAFTLAALVAWFAAGRILQPLTDLTEAARSVSESNWRERIEVEGDDQIAFLARTFNEMLDRLESAFDVQRRLVDDAGHELRTPITVIRGHLELMSDDPVDRDATLRLVMDELARMARMVDDLLLLARADRPDFLLRQPFDVDALVDDIAEKARVLADRGWEVDEGAPVVVVADQQRVTQAMMNLCRNAVEHTPDAVAVRLGSRVRGDWVDLWVEDDGPGIPASEQQRIFDRFARGDATAPAAEGAGLGLAISRVIAEAHGGHIAVESVPGEGARFAITLPLDAGQ